MDDRNLIATQVLLMHSTVNMIIELLELTIAKFATSKVFLTELLQPAPGQADFW